MGLPGPELKQRRPFEDKLPGVRRLCEPVEQTLQSVARQDELKLLAALAGEVHQALADGGHQVAGLPVRHAVASR